MMSTQSATTRMQAAIRGMCRSIRLTTGTRKNDSAMPMANTNRACPAASTTSTTRVTPRNATTNGGLGMRMPAN